MTQIIMTKYIMTKYDKLKQLHALVRNHKPYSDELPEYTSHFTGSVIFNTIL